MASCALETQRHPLKNQAKVKKGVLSSSGKHNENQMMLSVFLLPVCCCMLDQSGHPHAGFCEWFHLHCTLCGMLLPCHMQPFWSQQLVSVWWLVGVLFQQSSRFRLPCRDLRIGSAFCPSLHCIFIQGTLNVHH